MWIGNDFDHVCFNVCFPFIVFSDVTKEFRDKDDEGDEALTYIQVNLPGHKGQRIVGVGVNKKSAKEGGAKYAMNFIEENQLY